VIEGRKLRWFITGASSGFGLEIARAALARGDEVMATVRQAGQLAKLRDEGAHPCQLDVNDPAAVSDAVETAVSTMGGVDVLVNNAGFGMVGAIEALSMDDVRAVMETNFFGVLRVTQAFAPVLRDGKGTIVMISSVAGQVGFAGIGAYCGSKFALEGMADVLGGEMAPFGVDVMIVEPGAFRTDFSGRSIRAVDTSVDAYAGMQAGEAKSLVAQYHGHEPGDPVNAARIIVDVVKSGSPPRRLALGGDAVAGIEGRLATLKCEMGEWREASLATAFDS